MKFILGALPCVCLLEYLGGEKKKKSPNRSISVGNLGQQRVCDSSGEKEACCSLPSLPAAPSPAAGLEIPQSRLCCAVLANHWLRALHL